MSTPLERLTKIAKARTPSVVKFRYSPQRSHKTTLALESVIVKESELIPVLEDKELFDLLSGHVSETWDSEQDRYVVTTTPDVLWRYVLNSLIGKYERISKRCNATKRKTADFISKIKIDDKLLSGFILQTFIAVQSTTFKDISLKDRETLFEQFDSLRRTFGKRAR